MKTCSIGGCKRKYLAKGFCARHYHQNRLHGDPLGFTYRPTLSERLWAKVDKSGSCWVWTGAKAGGYGQIKRDGENVGAHRVSYEEAYGPIGDGLVVDHVCREKLCVRPSHLRVATQKQNMENLLGPHRNNAGTGVRGVYLKKNRFYIYAGHNGRKRYGGSYRTLAEATEAIREFRNRLHTHNLEDRMATK